MAETNTTMRTKRWLRVDCVTYGCLGIHKSSTVQRYQIYRLIEYIRHMFTTESSKGNLLIQMRLILFVQITQVYACFAL